MSNTKTKSNRLMVLDQRQVQPCIFRLFPTFSSLKLHIQSFHLCSMYITDDNLVSTLHSTSHINTSRRWVERSPREARRYVKQLAWLLQPRMLALGTVSQQLKKTKLHNMSWREWFLPIFPNSMVSSLELRIWQLV